MMQQDIESNWKNLKKLKINIRKRMLEKIMN